MSSRKSPSLHIVFFPMMAPGRFLPMVDMAHLFATRSTVNCTFITTPANAPLLNFKPNCSPINLHIIPFPGPSLTGLSPGEENLQDLHSEDSRGKFFKTISEHLQKPFRDALIELKPDAIITDGFYPWTADLAIERGIPRIFFTGVNYFTQCVYYALNKNQVRHVGDGNLEFFEFPHKFEVPKSQLHDPMNGGPLLVKIYEEIAKAEDKSYATVMNTFYETEVDYADYYRNVIGRKSWHVGPVFSYNQEEKKNDLEENECLKWLDKKEGKSVIYISFGTFGQLGSLQLAELATGLERSGHNFLWIIRDEEGDDWIPEGFFERISDRGLIIRKWGPQREILGHTAIGGFLTHCGWNSILEAIAAAVPMVTWPIFADQFLNEKFIVDIHKFGTALGATKNTPLKDDRPVIEAERIEKKLKWLMSDNEMRDIRVRMKEMKKKAKMANEVGGSSFNDLNNMIDELMNMKLSKL